MPSPEGLPSQEMRNYSPDTIAAIGHAALSVGVENAVAMGDVLQMNPLIREQLAHNASNSPKPAGGIDAAGGPRMAA